MKYGTVIEITDETKYHMHTGYVVGAGLKADGQLTGEYMLCIQRPHRDCAHVWKPATAFKVLSEAPAHEHKKNKKLKA